MFWFGLENYKFLISVVHFCSTIMLMNCLVSYHLLDKYHWKYQISHSKWIYSYLWKIVKQKVSKQAYNPRMINSRHYRETGSLHYKPDNRRNKHCIGVIIGLLIKGAYKIVIKALAVTESTEECMINVLVFLITVFFYANWS